MGRQCKVVTGLGKKGVGKSYETITQLYELARAKPYARKGLIFDVNNEFSDFHYGDDRHHKIKPISLSDIALFSSSNVVDVRRITPYFDDGSAMTLNKMSEVLSYILSVYRAGTLLVEDPTKYISDNISKDIIGALATARHLECDVIMHFQSVQKFCNPKIVANTNYVRLHKTNDRVSRYKDRLEDKYELFQIAENLVDIRYSDESNPNNKRFWVLIDNDDSKIMSGRTPFNERDIDLAIHKYISDNYRAKVSEYLNMRDFTTNQLVYREDSVAIKQAIKDLKKLYF
jgi:hypothetical protein